MIGRVSSHLVSEPTVLAGLPQRGRQAGCGHHQVRFTESVGERNRQRRRRGRHDSLSRPMGGRQSESCSRLNTPGKGTKLLPSAIPFRPARSSTVTIVVGASG